MNTKLERIANKYGSKNFNSDNYYIGGGLSDGAFASRRHEDAKSDEGKLTKGQATQLFKKATDRDIDFVKAIINYAVPNMEWHHAGKLPKQYGGGMKKTYFLNAKEIADLATNWSDYCEKYALMIERKRLADAEAKTRDQKRLEFLQNHAQRKVRVTNHGPFFYETDREMNGKYGWFSSYGKSYPMTEYVSGWEFDSEALYNEFKAI